MQLTVILEGVPAGLTLTAEHINKELLRRQKVMDAEDACKLKQIQLKL